MLDLSKDGCFGYGLRCLFGMSSGYKNSTFKGLI